MSACEGKSGEWKFSKTGELKDSFVDSCLWLTNVICTEFSPLLLQFISV
jgi:hypothetical protein